MVQFINKDKKKVHILDFDVGQGSQCINLLKALIERLGGPPHLRIIAVDDPEGITKIVYILENNALPET